MAQSHVGRVYCDAVAELLEYVGDAGAGVARIHVAGLAGRIER